MRAEHIIKQALLDARHGIVRDYSIPAEATYVRPSVAPTYGSISRSTGNRRPGDKSKFNVRGSYVNLADRRSMVLESALEFKAGKILLANREVKILREQWPTVRYLDAKGRWCSTTFDLWAMRQDGRSVALAIKPIKKIAEKRLIDQLLLIKDQGIGGFANDVSFVSEAYANSGAVANATSILFSRRARNEDDYLEALALIQTVRGQVRFRHLLQGAYPHAHRRNALWCLIDEGRLLPVAQGKIDDHTFMYVPRSHEL